MRRALPRHWNVILVAFFGGLILLTPFIADAQTNTWNDVIKLVIWNIVSQVGGFFVWVGGGILDFTITRFIVGYGAMFQSQGLGVAVNNLWTVTRDLFNLTFIFALVYIGFRMILDSDDSGAKKAIVNLVIAALLVNFSLFFTKAIVDFTNITATQVANVLYANNAGGTISGTFVQSMGLPSLWGPSGPTVGTIDSRNIATVSWSYILGVLILCLIAAFAFIAGAALLTVRFIVLSYFMVISPIMFIGRVFPFLQSWQSNFWSTFLKNAFFAPAFLLMLYFSLYILNQTRIIQSGGGLQQNMGASASNVNDIAMLLLVGGFLLASVIIGQKMGVVGSDVAIKAGKNLQGRGQRLVGSMTFGAGAALGQRTIGRAANRIADSDRMKGWAARSSIGAAAFKASNKVADASFDGRAALTGMGVKALGKGTKGGYDARLKEAKEADKKFAESLGEQKLGDLKTDAGRKKRAEQVNPLIDQIKADTTTEGSSGAELKKAQESKTNAEAAVAAAVASQDQVKQRIVTAQEPIQREITNLESRLSTEVDLTRRRDLQQQITAKRAELTTIANGFTTELNDASQTLATAKNKLQSSNEQIEKIDKEITKEAEARYTYARQLQLMERRRRQAQRYAVSVPFRVVGGGLTGTGAVVAGAGGVVAGGAAAAGYVASSIAGSYADSYAAAAEELEKIYGKDGSKKVKNKKDEEERKKLAKLLKEESEDKKKDDDKDDDDKKD